MTHERLHSCVARRGAAARRAGRLRHARRRDARDQREGRAGAEGVVQGARPGELDRLDQDETQQRVQRLRRQGAAEGRRGAHREGEPRDDQVAGRRQVLGDWKNGEKIAQEGRGKQYADDPKGPGRRQLLRLPPARRRRRSRTARSARLYQFGKLRGYTDEMRKYAYGKIYNAEAYRRVLATCRASATTASSPSSRSRTSSRC